MASRKPPAAGRPPAATAAVAGEWLRRIVAEYHSAAITQHLTLWLIQIGASPDLIRDGLRIVDDELHHAELSRRVWLAAGGAGAPALERDTLGLPRRHPTLELDAAAAITRIFCLGETIAVPLFQNLRKGATVAVARAALDRILADEVRHRDFGWTALGWLLEQPGADAVRGLIDRELGGWLAALDASYGEALVGGTQAISAGERAWGLAPAAEYAAILARTLERDYRPRFARLAIALPAAG